MSAYLLLRSVQCENVLPPVDIVVNARACTPDSPCTEGSVGGAIVKCGQQFYGITSGHVVHHPKKSIEAFR